MKPKEVIKVHCFARIDGGYRKLEYKTLLQAVVDVWQLSEEQQHELSNLLQGFQLENEVMLLE